MTEGRMRPPIRWFWSKTCGRLARKALKTAETLKINMDVIHHSIINSKYQIPQRFRSGMEGLVDLVVTEQ